MALRKRWALIEKREGSPPMIIARYRRSKECERQVMRCRYEVSDYEERIQYLGVKLTRGLVRRLGLLALVVGSVGLGPGLNVTLTLLVDRIDYRNHHRVELSLLI